ncbi:MAG: D-alanyl-D-alanine carboxypeptidase/D-alanyl-D-alanine-endopeptidase [Betaproteobacteria bacterium]|nr:D-alanyl-D-alanine carboxypeptidase/D-alanyl-D-alanine-endopeptidase [Betaproteobacteria bacterium]MCL2886465.1 D-alanyl-D-alanine carboxypeptidase/D-alanyl-D-alanine-endopeptidase [Betaproteobacteria bacterium]
MKRRLCCLACGLIAALARADLPTPVAQALAAAQIPPASVAVVVQPVDAPTPLLEHNAGQAMNPASVTKLLTTYAALDLLGPAHVWPTTVWSDGALANGALAGNLYVKGSGDPRFAIEHLWALLRQLRARGIAHIAGDIVLDASAFAPLDFDPAAFDNKPLRPYNVGPSALLINFQSLRFTLQAAGSQVRIWLETPSEGLRLDNRLRLSAGPCPGDWKDRITLRRHPENGGQRLEITGSYAAQCGERTLNLAPLPPAEQSAGLIRALWRELGGELRGTVRPGRLPADATLLARHESPPLAEIVRDINKFSSNVMARQVFLSLGGEAEGDDPPASAERARQRVVEWLAKRRLSFPELVLDNGSGLSRRERISAASLNRLLLDAWRHPLMPEFIASLPLTGIDGTMKKRLHASAAVGRAHIKTGSLDGVKTAAGYALDSTGRVVAVTMLINDPRAEGGAPAIDALLSWIATGVDRP